MSQYEEFKRRYFMSQWERPQELAELDYAFGTADVMRRLLPKWEEIPEEFRIEAKSVKKWYTILGDWFYGGIKLTNVVMKNNIDKKHAIRHIGCIMHSYDPKHEHKIAGCAYLMSLWFETVEYIRAEEDTKYVKEGDRGEP